MQILSINDSLHLNTGYSHQMRQLIPAMVEKYGHTWVTMSPQYSWGQNQYLREWKCTQAASGMMTPDGKMRDPTNLRRTLDEYKIDFTMVVDDIQRLPYWGQFLTRDEWMSWFPKDNDAVMQEELDILERVPYKVTYSKFASKFYRDLNIDIPYVYVPIDTNTYKDVRETEEFNSWLDKHPWMQAMRDADEHLLLWVGRPNWRKNLYQLLGAVKILRERGQKVRLYLNTDYRDMKDPTELDKLIEVLGLNEAVMVGNVNWDQGIDAKTLRNLYNLADVYVSTHGGEGFGIPLAESMACGTPIVATDFTTTQEFVGNYERGIAVSFQKRVMDKGIARPVVEPKVFADEVQYLLENPSDRIQMGKNAAKFAADEFDPKKISAKMQALIKDFDVNSCSMEVAKRV